MRIIFALVTLIVLSFSAYSQTLYTKAYGKPTDPAIVFLHGGPGYNSVNFEATTAQPLADRGFYVIVYDRRGEGRSEDKDSLALYTFKESIDDLNAVYNQYKVKRAALLAHSFGGIIACYYAQAYPSRVQSLILVSAPVSLQATFDYIRAQCKVIYTENGDVHNLGYMTKMDSMDKASIEYSSYTFIHAMQNGFYSPKNLSDEAKALKEKMRNDPEVMAQAKMLNMEATKGFWKNEAYTTIDLTATIEKLKAKKVTMYAIYGKDDRLYSPEQVAALQKILGTESVVYLDNCAHNAFIDQQAAFLDAVSGWVK